MWYYGAVLVDARVAVNDNIISAAGVTAGLDAALALVALLRGDATAQEIQLAIEYAPNPVFRAVGRVYSSVSAERKLRRSLPGNFLR